MTDVLVPKDTADRADLSAQDRAEATKTERLYLKPIDLATRFRNVAPRRRLPPILGKLHARGGRLAEAKADLATATAMYREMGMQYWLEKAEPKGYV